MVKRHAHVTDTMNPTHDKPGGTLSPWRICALAGGWLVAIFGALSLVSVPLYLAFLLLIAGTVIGSLAYRGGPPMTWGAWVVVIGGCALIVGALSLFGQETVRHWTPHPAGYIPAWVGCFHAFRQVRYLLIQHDKAPEAAV